MRNASRIAAALVALAGGAATLGVTLAPRDASAQAAADPYKQHMDNGLKLAEDGNYAAAIVEFEAAYKANPKWSPLNNIAFCHKHLFDYPKAIAALEMGLARHGDGMSADEKATAEKSIADMKALLGHVFVRLTPPEATLTVDGEDQPPGTALKPVPLGPGTHKIGAHMKGYSRAEETVTVASGAKGQVVVLRLVADKGWVTVHGHDAKTALYIDGKYVGAGQWADLLPPGTHRIHMTRPGVADYIVEVDVLPGRSEVIRPGFGGRPYVGPTPVLPPPIPVDVPPPPRKPPPPEPPVRGFFGLVTASLLVPTAHPRDFPYAEPNSGAAGGIRIGYRVNTAASFDLMFEYGNVAASAILEGGEGDGETDYSLSTARFGLNLRLMTPGKSVRMVGTIGGGFSLSDLSVYRFDGATGVQTGCADDCAGADAFLLGELGAELDFGGVLVGLSAQSYFQSTKGMQTGTYKPYGNDPLVFLGGGLRVGYATW